jgi:hypothetical protein
MAIKSFTRSTIENNIFYRSMLAGNTAFAPSDEDILAEEVLTTTTASVTFSSLATLAAGYQHLQIRLTARTNVASDNDVYRIQLNGDTGTNYSSHRMYGNGSSVVANAYTSEDFMRNLGAIAGNTATANVFGAGIIDILDAFEATKYTTVRSFSGTWRTTSGLVGLQSGMWMNTAAVSSILIDGLSGSFVAGSRFTLIGLK